MVVASPAPVPHEKVRGVPVVDLSSRKPGRAAELMVRACEDLGFFKVINHGVPAELVAKMEEEASAFFALPLSEKHGAWPASPLGYGRKNIGFNGDTGEVEYLLLQANPASSSSLPSLEARTAVCGRDPAPVSFSSSSSGSSSAMGAYVGAVGDLAAEILDLMGEGLRLRDGGVLRRLVGDSHSDSLLRFNHYPPCSDDYDDDDDHWEEEEEEENRGAPDRPVRRSRPRSCVAGGDCRVGFGEHTDPQVITLLRCNDATGLQVMSPPDDGGGGVGVWVPVPPDPSAFFVNVGDVLQALTNGRCVSARHRAVVSSSKPRLSMVYFAAPPPHARISPLPEMVAPERPCLYRPFTWAEYKKVMYSLGLGHNRLELFRQHRPREDEAASR